jgi:hypothetical protein
MDPTQKPRLLLATDLSSAHAPSPVDQSTSSHHLSKQVRIMYCRASIACRSCTVASKCCRMYFRVYACNDGGLGGRLHAPHSRPSFWIARTSASSAAMSAEQVQHTSHHRQAAHCMDSQKHPVSLETASTSTVLLHEQTRMPEHDSTAHCHRRHDHSLSGETAINTNKASLLCALA